MSHILLRTAVRKPYLETPKMPEGATYERALGVWTVRGEPLVNSKEYASNPVSKKCDQETGEDQKGE